MGVDHDRLPAATLWLLKERMPGVTWEDASPLLTRLRMIKTGVEVELLEAGTTTVAAAAHSRAGERRLTADGSISLPRWAR